MESRNWHGMYDVARRLHKLSGIVGAGRVYYACYYMMVEYSKHSREGMITCYALLVETAIEAKRYTRRYLAENNGKLVL